MTSVAAAGTGTIQSTLRPGAGSIAARVRALAAGKASDGTASRTFAAAEARVRALGETAAASPRDRADAAMLYAADALVTMMVEEGASAVEDIEKLVETVADVTGLSTDTAAFSLYMRASASPQILNLAPRVAAEAHLRLLVGLAPVTDASLWADELGGATCIAAVGGAAQTRRFRSIAAATIDGAREPADDDARTQIAGVPIIRWGRPVAAVVARARPEHRARASVFLLECRGMLAPVLERDVLLDRSASREQQLQMASERRLLRVGFDLHDGPLQDVAALASDLRLAREQLSDSLHGRLRSILLGRFDDLGARLADIDQTLRELSHSLESSRVGTSPLSETLRRELAGFDRRSGIEGSLTVTGSFESLSASQRIAIFRIAQESLANVREHSAATQVSITLEEMPDGVRLLVSDDGVGFDVSHTVVAAARRGRLGLVGMSERVRLLGGAFSLTSSPGGGTNVCVTLPSWQPVGGARTDAKTATGG
ncbi:MAG: sensor histidine kinase [Gaiellaceae bacterium]